VETFERGLMSFGRDSWGWETHQRGDLCEQLERPKKKIHSEIKD